MNQPIAAGGWVATHEDITERQALLLARDEAVRQLREQKVVLDTALNNMAHGLCMFDAQGRLILFNRAILRDDATAGRVAAGPLAARPDESAQVDRRIHARPRSVLFEHSRRGARRRNHDQNRGDRAADARCASSIIRWPNGGWVATFEDITEQRQTEQDRDRNREFLDQIIENVPVTIVVKDAVTRKFVLANRAAEIHWSFNRHEAIGKTPHHLFPKPQADIMTEHDDRRCASRGSDCSSAASQSRGHRQRTHSHLETPTYPR